MLKKESLLIDHPYIIAKYFADKYGEDINFEFSQYIYKPQDVFDQRHIFTISGADLTEDRIYDLLMSLGSDEELAMHSKVKIKGKKFHVPMIDFATTKLNEKNLTTLKYLLPKNINDQLVIFNSGRSYHGYSLDLLQPGEWMDFLGRLLLTNLPEGDVIVDTRWIGHRLIAGYSSLRWSCNTSYYKKYPTIIDSYRNLRIDDSSKRVLASNILI